MSITLPPPVSPAAGPDDPRGRRSAWYAASRRRLGLTEDVWYDPAVEHVLEALALDEPIGEAAGELGNARGAAGFDLRETASDLDALAEVLPADVARRLQDEGNLAALVAWADAFIDRAHPPACVDAMTGLVTPAYLRVRIAEVHRECDERGHHPADRFALVVVGPGRPPETPLARLAARLRAGRSLRDWFPGGESACLLHDAGVVVLAPRDDRLEPRVRGLAAALDDGRGTVEQRIEPLGRLVHHTQRRFDALTAPGPAPG